jgi:hypothetical protein
MSLFGRLARGRSQRPSAVPRARLLVEELESRLVPSSVSGNAWPNPQLITLSFVPDGTILGSNGNGSISSNLFANFNGRFGSAARWQNEILRAAQTWAQQTNINFAVIPDNGTPIGSGNFQQGDPAMGDIRFGGYNFGTTTLAQSYMPPPVNNYSIAGDIQFNTGQSYHIGTTYDLFTVAEHEIGHALGLYHSSISSAAMFGSYNGVKHGLNSDDVAGIRSIYSNGNPRSLDSYAGANGSFATAADLTSQIDPVTLTAAVENLDITTPGQTEFFTFTAPSLTDGTLTMNVQSSVLSLLAPTLTVFAADQTTVLGSASGLGQYGTTLSATVNGVTAGQQFYVEVTGADASPFGTGAYGLGLTFGPAPVPSPALPNTQVLNDPIPHAGGGQAVEFGETLVNTITAGTQATFAQTPKAVTMDANGNYVVVWSSNGQDGSGWGVYAQRYSTNGTPQGGEFQVNTTTAGDQMYPNVAMDPVGDFVITWSGHDSDGWHVYAQPYNAAGVAQGSELRASSIAGDQEFSSVAMDATGNFVITWSHSGRDGSGWGVYARRFSAAGVALASSFQVNTYTAGDQMYPSIAMDGAGDFVITWSSNGQDGSGWGVYAQRYSADGTAQGGEFRVNTQTISNQWYSDVAMDGQGNFVITWTSQYSGNRGVFAQRYNAAGAPQGGEFRVNATPGTSSVYAMYSRVAMEPTGSFIITWSTYGQDLLGTWGIYARQYTQTGEALGAELQVNKTIIGDQIYSSVAMDSNGHALIVWSGNGVGDVDGVFAQRIGITEQNSMAVGAGDVPPDAAPQMDNDYVADPSLTDGEQGAAASLGGTFPGTTGGTMQRTMDLLVFSANGTLVHPKGCQSPLCLGALARQSQHRPSEANSPVVEIQTSSPNSTSAASDQPRARDLDPVVSFGPTRDADPTTLGPNNQTAVGSSTTPRQVLQALLSSADHASAERGVILFAGSTPGKEASVPSFSPTHQTFVNGELEGLGMDIASENTVPATPVAESTNRPASSTIPGQDRLERQDTTPEVLSGAAWWEQAATACFAAEWVAVSSADQELPVLLAGDGTDSAPDPLATVVLFGIALGGYQGARSFESRGTKRRRFQV